MPEDEPVACWIERIKAGGETVTANIRNHFCARLIGLVRRKLQGAPPQVADESDVGVPPRDVLAAAHAGPVSEIARSPRSVAIAGENLRTRSTEPTPAPGAGQARARRGGVRDKWKQEYRWPPVSNETTRRLPSE